MKTQSKSKKTIKRVVSNKQRTWKAPKAFIEELAVEHGDYDSIAIFGKFTRPVGSYRRGFKKPLEG